MINGELPTIISAIDDAIIENQLIKNDFEVVSMVTCMHINLKASKIPPSKFDNIEPVDIEAKAKALQKLEALLLAVRLKLRL